MLCMCACVVCFDCHCISHKLNPWTIFFINIFFGSHGLWHVLMPQQGTQWNKTKVREEIPWGQDSPCQAGPCTAHFSKMCVPNWGKLDKWASGDLFIYKGQHIKSEVEAVINASLQFRTRDALHFLYREYNVIFLRIQLWLFTKDSHRCYLSSLHIKQQ